MSTYARAVAPHAEAVAHLLAHSSPGKIALRTPLSRRNTIAQQVRGQRSANRRPADPPTPACRTCGESLSDKRLATVPCLLARHPQEPRCAAAARGTSRSLNCEPGARTPTVSAEAASKRSASLSARKREQLNWSPDPQHACSRERYQAEIQPQLALLSDCPLSPIPAGGPGVRGEGASPCPTLSALVSGGGRERQARA